MYINLIKSLYLSVPLSRTEIAVRWDFPEELAESEELREVTFFVAKKEAGPQSGPSSIINARRRSAILLARLMS